VTPVNDRRKSSPNDSSASILHCGFHVRAHVDPSPRDLFSPPALPAARLHRPSDYHSLHRDSPRLAARRGGRAGDSGGGEGLLFFTSDLFAAGRSVARKIPA